MLSKMVEGVIKMKKGFIKGMAYSAVLSLVLLTSIAFAEPIVQGPAGEEGREELAVSDIARELGLTTEQKEQFKEQRYQAKVRMVDTRSKIMLKKLELRHELEKKEVDRKALGGIVEELKKLHGIMLEQRVDSILKTREILTPEQFEKLQSLSERRMRKGPREGVKKSHRQRKR